jgi:sugar/nucleoside kinase (ribokinase family)
MLLLGEALVDLICERPVSSIAEAGAFVPHFGGATANVAVTVARGGASVALAGGAGDDAWGTWLRDRLAAEGVRLDWFALVPGAKTPVAFVTVDAAGEPSFLIHGDGIASVVEALGAGAVAAMDACDALFIASNTLVGDGEREVTMAVRARALEQGKPVVFDPNLRLHRWRSATHAAATARECVRDAFLVKCNLAEAQLLTGEPEPEAAAAGLLANGARHVVITRGADGAMLRGGGMRLDAPGVPSKVVNTTGAGDTLAGVLLARCAAAGWYPPAIAAALPHAVAEAARATERWGAVA